MNWWNVNIVKNDNKRPIRHNRIGNKKKGKSHCCHDDSLLYCASKLISATDIDVFQYMYSSSVTGDVLSFVTHLNCSKETINNVY